MRPDCCAGDVSPASFKCRECLQRQRLVVLPDQCAVGLVEVLLGQLAAIERQIVSGAF